MKTRFRTLCVAAAFVLGCAAQVPVLTTKPGDHDAPQPKKVTPAVPSLAAKVGVAPSDAVVLFDGKDLSAWKQRSGKPMAWEVVDGALMVKPGSGDIVTKQAFGDAQIHVEWATPNPTKGSDQEPGNSGIYIMSRYEIQVLDNYVNKTYPDGQAGSVYCQYPPLVNASLPPGEWQSYDIIWHGPRFDAQGNVTRAAVVTVFHNGVLVQDHVALTGPTDWLKRPPYKAHAVKEPLLLQDHHNPSRFRNIWIRELGD